MSTDADGNQSAGRGSATRASRLRYPLRSATRLKASQGEGAALPSNATRGRPIVDLTKSMGVLDLSGSTKPSKAPHRRSVTTKSSASPRPNPSSSNTPVSGIARSIVEGRSDTPSTLSISSGRRKFSALCSVSYWLAQIRVAEEASKHPISLGFFKLALQSGCEPLDRMKDELKNYLTRNGLVDEHDDSVKELLELYGISEELVQLKAATQAVSAEQPKAGKPEKPWNLPAPSQNGSLKPRLLNLPGGNPNNGGKADLALRSSVVKKPQKVAESRGGKSIKQDSAGKKNPERAKQSAEDEDDQGNALAPEEASGEDKENIGSDARSDAEVIEAV